MASTERRTKAQMAADEAVLRGQLAAAQRPLVVRNYDGLTKPAAVIGATILGAALIMSGGVKIGGGSEASSFSPSATPSTKGEANPNGTPTLPDGTPFTLVTAAPTPYLSSSIDGNNIGASSNGLETPGAFKEGAKLAKGIELPSVISSEMVRSFYLDPSDPSVIIDGNKIAQYQDSQLFLPVYNAAHAGSADNYVGIGPWAPIAIQNVTGAAHLKTEGDTGLFDVVADEPGSIALYFTQLGAHQHETAVNGNGQSNPDWPNQYTLHLKPYQKVWVIDRNGNQILWDDGVTPMALDAGPNGDFSIQVPQTATNQDVVFGLLLDVDPSQQGVQATAIKVQRGPDDELGKTGENIFAKLGILAIVIPAIPEQ